MEAFEEERAKISFDKKELYQMVWDKEELAGMMQTVSQSFVTDPILKIDHSFFDLPREKQIGFNMKRAARMLELSKEGKFPQVSMMNIGLIADKSGSISAVGLHFGMFETVIRYLGSDEQVKEYEQDVLDLKITGCYAQTEIGHGSDVSSLETTAIFDKETDSFIINSPSLTSGKCWPGELGKTSTHAVFHAQMIIGDKNYGVQSFICQIRDLNTHRPLRGLEIGDIGPKGGYNQKDNGYMYFKNFAVPRTALLSRYIKVDREGNFSVNGDPKIAYATMMFIRIYLIHVTSLYPVVGLLIAIRYAIFRKQFKTLKDGTAERKIMDYQAHQTTLVPILAFSFAALFTKTKMYWDYFEMMDKIHKKNDFKMLKDMHSIASCLKSFYTDRTLEDLKIIRECCGGHGFSAYSGLPNLIDCVSPNVTLEGDNTVMYQQTAAHLVKSCASILQGKQLKNSLVYLNDISTFEEQQLKKFDSENIDELISILKVHSLYHISRVAKALQLGEGSFEHKWNRVYQADVIKIAKAHAMYHTGFNFVEGVKNTKVSDGLKQILICMCKIHLAHSIINYADGAILSGYAKAKHLVQIEEMLYSKIEEIRPQLLNIVEAYISPASDASLNSVIGTSDGMAYDHLFRAAANNPLNSKDKLDVTEKYLNPLSLKLRAKI